MRIQFIFTVARMVLGGVGFTPPTFRAIYRRGPISTCVVPSHAKLLWCRSLYAMVMRNLVYRTLLAYAVDFSICRGTPPDTGPQRRMMKVV